MKKYFSVLFLLLLAAPAFSTSWTITTSGNLFSPDSITITQGDTVIFVLGSGHNAQEVDSATWFAGNATPVTGFQTAFAVTENVTGLTVGTHFYVCANHAGIGMKGKIVVKPAPTVQFVITSTARNEDAGSLGIAVYIINPDADNTSVDINVMPGGTASSGVDYTYSPITVTFPGGQQIAQIITVNIADDQLTESTESVTFQLANATNNATIGANSQHTVTIVDNDQPQFTISPSTQLHYEDAGQITVPVQLTNASPNAVSVTLQLVAPGTTATQGTDFLFSDTTITWAANSTSTILVPLTVIDDTLFEQPERVRLQLTNPTGGVTIANDTFLLTIQNNDTLTLVNCTDLFFTEYIHADGINKALEVFNPTSQPVDLSDYRIFLCIDGGVSTGVFGLTGILSPDSTYVIGRTGSGPTITARADTLTDFLTFDGNDAIALLHNTDTVDIIGKLWDNPGLGWPIADLGSTWFNTSIRKYYNYKGGLNWNYTRYTWTCIGTDVYDSLGFHSMAPCGSVPPRAVIRFMSPGITVPESHNTSIPVIIEVQNPGPGAVSFRVGPNNGISTASAQVDYQSPTFNYMHNPGLSYDTFYINVLEDLLLEPTETAVLYLHNLSGYAMFDTDSVYNLNITDNDVLTVSFLGAGFSYVEDTGNVQVKVTLSGKVPTATYVAISLAAGNATRGVDFLFNDTTVIFPPNSSDTQSIWVRILHDTIIEPNEQINFNLTDTSDAFPGIVAYTLTIIDNDSPNGLWDIDLADNIKVYPNPVLNTMVVQTETDLNDVIITDLVGNTIIKAGPFYIGKNIIDVSNLAAGMYFIAIQNESRVYSKRFIKQN